MTFATAAGTTLALSAAAPATYNAAGYGALTWTTVGRITDIGDIPDKTYEVVTVNYVASRGAVKAKGGFDLGSQTITVTIDDVDTGQALIDAAVDSDNPYSVKIDHPSLGTRYARALVMGGARTYGDVNSAATRSITLEYTIVSDSEDGIVID